MVLTAGVALDVSVGGHRAQLGRRTGDLHAIIQAHSGAVLLSTLEESHSLDRRGRTDVTNSTPFPPAPGATEAAICSSRCFPRKVMLAQARQPVSEPGDGQRARGRQRLRCVATCDGAGQGAKGSRVQILVAVRAECDPSAEFRWAVPGTTAAAPSPAHWPSPAPATMGSPSGRPVAWLAEAVTSPITIPGNQAGQLGLPEPGGMHQPGFPLEGGHIHHGHRVGGGPARGMFPGQLDVLHSRRSRLRPPPSCPWQPVASSSWGQLLRGVTAGAPSEVGMPLGRFGFGGPS